MLEIQNLSVAVSGATLAEGVALTLSPGERVAIVGPSGSGKTTLLRTICGLTEPATGAVLWEGKTGDSWGWPAFRRRVTLSEQRPAVLDTSVEENLRRPFAYKSASGVFPQERAREFWERVGMGAVGWEQNARTLSVGQQQRLCLIRALLLESPVLLMDEPTSALEPESVGSVEALLIAESERRGLACLIVTHSPEQARRLCGRTLNLAEFRPGGKGKP